MELFYWPSKALNSALLVVSLLTLLSSHFRPGEISNMFHIFGDLRSILDDLQPAAAGGLRSNQEWVSGTSTLGRRSISTGNSLCLTIITRLSYKEQTKESNLCWQNYRSDVSHPFLSLIIIIVESMHV